MAIPEWQVCATPGSTSGAPVNVTEKLDVPGGALIRTLVRSDDYSWNTALVFVPLKTNQNLDVETEDDE
jgi:hypothetical protein